MLSGIKPLKNLILYAIGYKIIVIIEFIPFRVQKYKKIWYANNGASDGEKHTIRNPLQIAVYFEWTIWLGTLGKSQC